MTVAIDTFGVGRSTGKCHLPEEMEGKERKQETP